MHALKRKKEAQGRQDHVSSSRPFKVYQLPVKGAHVRVNGASLLCLGAFLRVDAQEAPVNKQRYV